jgi:hypothetical protein
MKQSKEGDDSLWQKTPYANLVRYKPSKKYFARLRVNGKLIRRGLKTNVLSVAKLRLGDLEKAERQLAEHQIATVAGNLTFGGALTTYRQRLAGDASLKPRTRDYQEQRIKALLKSWPGLERDEVRNLSKADCLAWAAKFVFMRREKNAAQQPSITRLGSFERSWKLASRRALVTITRLVSSND